MTKRKYRSQADWQLLIEQQVQSGLSGAEFCKRHGLVAKYFYRKRRQLQNGQALVPTGGSFVRVSPEPSLEAPTEAGLMLQFRECRLQLPTSTDSAWLAQLLQSL